VRCFVGIFSKTLVIGILVQSSHTLMVEIDRVVGSNSLQNKTDLLKNDCENLFDPPQQLKV